MNWVDLVVILLAVVVALIGARQGFIVALPAIVLLIIGALLGVKLAPLLVEHLSSTPLRAAFSVAIPVLLGALGETLGSAVGRAIKRRIRNPKLSGVDNALGALLQAAVTFVVAWLALFSLTGLPGLPNLVSAINGSRVLGAVNSVMPAAAKQIPAQLKQELDLGNFPPVSNPFTKTPIRKVAPPDTALQTASVVRTVRSQVLKINAQAPQCSLQLEGSGFVIAPQRVMTNAHVVAGSDYVSVRTRTSSLRAHVVYYDPNTDIAVLDVPNLRIAPLSFDTQTAASGTDSIVLGYPLDGPYTASPAKVRQELSLRGQNIYGTQDVTRDVYTVRAQVRSGNSGGPLVDTSGRVRGVVFGAAVDDPETGFALTSRQVAPAVRAAPGRSAPVSTGQCAG
ncbi:MAG: MarP family serine protease [Sciscionella sp.]